MRRLEVINFISVEYQNFLSTGSQPVKIMLNEFNKSLIRGLNGAGKSTALESLCYGLFNKPLRPVKLNQLVNSINRKKMLVKVNFEINGTRYEVHRGQKPAIFDIIVDGESLDQDASSRNMQEKLEEILGCDYKAFMQVVVMSSTNSKYFMELSTPERRTFVESMLDIEVIGQMSANMKARVKEVQFKKTQISTQLEICKNNISAKKEIVDSLNTVSETQLQNLYDEKSSVQTEHDKTSKEYNEALNEELTLPESPTHPEFIEPPTLELPEEPVYECTDDIVFPEFTPLADLVLPDAPCEYTDVIELNTVRVNLENEIQKLIDSANDVRGVASFYTDNENCDRCHQPIDDAFKENIVKESNEKLGVLGSEYNDKNNELQAVIQSIDTANTNNSLYRNWEADCRDLSNKHEQAVIAHKNDYQQVCDSMVNDITARNSDIKNAWQWECNDIKSKNNTAYTNAKTEYSMDVARANSEHNQIVLEIKTEYNTKLEKAKLNFDFIDDKLKTLIKNITKLESEKNNDAEKHINDLSELTKQEADLLIQLASITEEEELCSIGTEMLKDSGLKAKIIKQYLPKINHSINEYLDKLGGDYSFVLDEEFNETIKHRYRDNYSYASFSNGERSRINFAIMLMWRELAKSKNTVSSNLLFIDEVLDGALDDEGIYGVMDLFEEMVGTNIFVISHRKEISSFFDQVVDVNKVGNFSNYIFSEN